jgi:hypothetical protein
MQKAVPRPAARDKPVRMPDGFQGNIEAVTSSFRGKLETGSLQQKNNINLLHPQAA